MCYYNHYIEQLTNNVMQENRKNNNIFLQLQQMSETWPASVCIQEKHINTTRITPELIHIPERFLDKKIVCKMIFAGTRTK